MKLKTAFATLLLLPFAGAMAADEATATPPPANRDPARTFKLFDRNGDGGVSLEEYTIGMRGQMDPARVGEVFKKKDADGDGKLTLPELMFATPRDVGPLPWAKGPKKEKGSKKEEPKKEEAK